MMNNLARDFPTEFFKQHDNSCWREKFGELSSMCTILSRGNNRWKLSEYGNEDSVFVFMADSLKYPYREELNA